MYSNDDFILKFELRDLTGKKVKKIRKEKKLPGSIFGYKGNLNITVDLNEFNNVFKNAGHTKLVTLVSENDTHKVFIDDVQLHPVSREVMHVSFREVPETQEVDVYVPIILEGVEESPAYKEDKQLVILITNAVEIRSIPSKLPSEIRINVSNFKTGDVLLLKDLKLPEDVKLVHQDEHSLNQVIVTTTSAVIVEGNENPDKSSTENLN